MLPIRLLIADSLVGISTLWVVVWLGLAAPSVALSCLMLTNWGTSHPLRKCAVLSLLAHLLLAYVFTSIKIMSDMRGDGSGSAIDFLLAGPGDGGNADEGEPTHRVANGEHSESSPDTVAEAVEPAVEPPKRVEVAALAPETPQPEIAPRPDAAVTPAKLEVASAAKPTQPDLALAPVPRPFTAARPPGPIDTSALDVVPNEANAVPETNTQLAAAGTGATHDVEGAAPLASAEPTATEIDAQGAPPLRRVPTIYKQRLASDRSAALRGGGGGADTEAAVNSALRWLAANQEADGRWSASKHGAGRESRTLGHDRQGAGAGADTGITGLALLAYLGAGHTHLRGDYQDTVRRGLEFLLNEQSSDGNLSGGATLFARTYCHGMATLALGEACAMSGDSRLLPAVKAAAAWSVAMQHPGSGGWRYQTGDLGDTSQHGWQVMALRSAELSGANLPQETRSRMIRFLASVAAGERGGLASYRPRHAPSRAMTAEALFCRQLLDENLGTAACQEAANYLLGELPGQGDANFYYWYYATLALHQLQGESWQQWNAALKPALISTQRTDKSQAGSWDPDPVWGSYGGRVFATSLGCLCLEVYYRYLPVYMEAARRRTP